MKPTTIKLHSRFQVGAVDSRLFGGFIEHIGRCVYEGVYEPGSPLADSDGYRTDVMAALRRLRMTAMRYPGGNFASGYHWPDGVGPAASRPAVRELAWQSIEPNTFGTDEYIRLCHKMGWTPMLTINLGTGTPEEARNWVEYCNCPTGTKYADMRAANGHAEPYGVRLWCLGNEMDGPWQLGHVPADQYAIRAQQAAKMMKDVDRSIEVIACGSCTTGLPSYMEWDRQVLEYMGDLADYVSLHRYVGKGEGWDTLDYLSTGNSVDRQIEEMDAACRYVAARRRSEKRAWLCFDEWNVWYKAITPAHTDGAGRFAPHLVEEIYNLEDALMVAGFLNSFIRHADVVKIANLAQVVNVIAPLQTRGDRLLVQPTFYPFEMFAARRDGVALRTVVDGPAYEAKSYGHTHFIDASAILDGAKLHVFAVNRSPEEAAPLQVELADGCLDSLASAELLTGPHAAAANSFEQPDIVCPQLFSDVRFVDGRAATELPPLSLLAMTFGVRHS